MHSHKQSGRQQTDGNGISSNPLNKAQDGPSCQATPATTLNDWNIEWNIKKPLYPNDGKHLFMVYPHKIQVSEFGVYCLFY